MKVTVLSFAHHPLGLGRQQQVEVDSGQRREGAFGLGRCHGEAAVEVGNEDLLEVAIRLGVGGNAMQA